MDRWINGWIDYSTVLHCHGATGLLLYITSLLRYSATPLPLDGTEPLYLVVAIHHHPSHQHNQLHLNPLLKHFSVSHRTKFFILSSVKYPSTTPPFRRQLYTPSVFQFTSISINLIALRMTCHPITLLTALARPIRASRQPNPFLDISTEFQNYSQNQYPHTFQRSPRADLSPAHAGTPSFSAYLRIRYTPAASQHLSVTKRVGSGSFSLCLSTTN